ncbi:hypothetical protein [Microbispora sp. ATCC PTA-5024]|uniref:hypothetical protein n=1 Tax=Microbispora sp. ATCC PTA-5024 TaxID=316330 RepID=UPI0003DD824B|nr:hypothetical protein [Microbispora sp. ATCC PTA-5024]ETK35501.1 hypothetical protein MPTA5024_13815 [Microbispora sp. ATCC PTA-5024]
MKDGLKVALAVIAGYYLGRHHKLRFAFMLALAILAGRLKGEGAVGTILEQGTKILGSSPELGKITDRVRGDLLDIGKAAAMRATSKQIDSLSDRLHERAEALRQPKSRRAEEEEEEPREGRRRVPRPGARRPASREPEPAEEYDEEYEEPYDEGEEEEEPEPEERPRPRPRPARPVTRSRR